jgi:hypothetical protein
MSKFVERFGFEALDKEPKDFFSLHTSQIIKNKKMRKSKFKVLAFIKFILFKF